MSVDSKRFAACVCALLLLGAVGHGATVTLDAPGGGDYTTLKDAIDDYANWSDGDDVIEVTDSGAHFLNEQLALPVPATQLTIQHAAGADPIFVVKGTLDNEGVVAIEIGTGTFTLDGLIFIGQALVQSAAGQAAIGLMESTDGATDLTIRNCLFSKNTALDQPEVRYSSVDLEDMWDFDAQDEQRSIIVGNMYHHVIMISPSLTQILNLTVEDSIFAFPDPRRGHALAIGFETDVAQIPAGSEVLISGCAFFYGQNSVSLGGVHTGITATVRDCFFWNDFGFPDTNTINIVMGTEGHGGVPDFDLIIEDSILAGSQVAGVQGEPFFGTLTMNRCTVAVRSLLYPDFTIPGATLPAGEGREPIHMPGLIRTSNLRGSFFLTDSIFVGGARDADEGGGVINFRPNAVDAGPLAPDPPFAQLVVNNIAAYDVSIIPEAPFSPEQVQSVTDVFAASNAIGGLLDPDPLFVKIAIDSSIDGIRKWDSETNTLFDVAAPEYAGFATGGANLSGGAEYLGDEPVNPAALWSLYQ